MKSLNNPLFCFLAQGRGTLPNVPPRPNGATLQSWLSPEVLAVLGVIAALALGLFVWAFFIRRRKPTDPGARAIEGGLAPAEDANPSRSPHGHRNPTLQETGGLPPSRPEDEPPKF
jgi:hypothetical protein